MSTYQNILGDLKEYLDWNRWMTVGFTFWALLVALVNSNTSEVFCTSSYPFPGVIWIAGLVVLAGTVIAEAVTDYNGKDDPTKFESWHFSLKPFSKQPALVIPRGSTAYIVNSIIRVAADPSAPNTEERNLYKISMTSIFVRFVSNALLFYTIIALTTYGWFVVGGTCFVNWSQHAKDWSLGAIGIAGILVLLVRITFFDYVTVTPVTPTVSASASTAAGVTAALLAIQNYHPLPVPAAADRQAAPTPAQITNVSNLAARAAAKAEELLLASPAGADPAVPANTNPVSPPSTPTGNAPAISSPMLNPTANINGSPSM